MVNLDPPVVSETTSPYFISQCQTGNSFWCGSRGSSLPIIVNVQLSDQHDEGFIMSEIIPLIRLAFGAVALKAANITGATLETRGQKPGRLVWRSLYRSCYLLLMEKHKTSLYLSHMGNLLCAKQTQWVHNKQFRRQRKAVVQMYVFSNACLWSWIQLDISIGGRSRYSLF